MNMTEQAELFEKLAAIEHERWADWQRYLHGRCSPVFNSNADDTGQLVISKKDVEHWVRQIDTPYADLSEKEKQSDRDQVNRYWQLITELWT